MKRTKKSKNSAQPQNRNQPAGITAPAVLHSQTIRFTALNCLGSLILGFGKLLLGWTASSFFTCVSALYTFGMTAARITLINGAQENADIRKRIRISACLLIVSSLFYGLTSIRFYLIPETDVWPLSPALAIAAFTFAELALNIKGSWQTRRRREPLSHALKIINLASSLACLVLTQKVLLSLSDPLSHSAANGFFGMLMGGTAMLLGLWLYSGKLD